MLDHVFLDAIGALRDALEAALLERQAFEEGFRADILLGDIEWQTSYGLPGEGLPPRVLAEITLDWPTWAQTAYRSWYIGEPFDDPPRIEVEVKFRMQRLAQRPDPARVLRELADESPPVGVGTLYRTAPVLEQLLLDQPDEGEADGDYEEYALEVSYEGSLELDEQTLVDGSAIDGQLSSMGGWIASTLVRLGDLDLRYLPPLDRPDAG
jgi:hypothetical protein